MIKKQSQGEIFGIELAAIVMKAAHMTFNARRGRSIVLSCIKQLHERLHEIQPKKAKPSYKKARYGSKEAKL